MDKHPIIGDIRGHGLVNKNFFFVKSQSPISIFYHLTSFFELQFIGVDLVKDRQTREPHTKAAEHAVSRFREEKILMQRDGPFDNVLKMKPPMKFSKENVDHFVSTYLLSVITIINFLTSVQCSFFEYEISTSLQNN